MAKKSTIATLEHTFLHGGPFSGALYENVVAKFVDRLKQSLHDDADDALLCVVEDDGEVAMLLLEWDGTALRNENALDRLRKMWQGNYWTNTEKIIPEFVEHLSQGMLGVAGIKWLEDPNKQNTRNDVH